MRVCLISTARLPVIAFYIVAGTSFIITLGMLIREYMVYTSHLLMPRRYTTPSMDRYRHHIPPPHKIGNSLYNNGTLDYSRRCHKQHFEEILLLVGYGIESEYESMPLLELLYKGGFSKRVYCGPSALTNESEIEIHVVDTRKGAFLYDCLTSAMKKYTNVRGYLFVGEEVLLNFWNYLEYDRDFIWVDSTAVMGPALYRQTTDSWEWWASPWGLRALEKAYETLIEMVYTDSRKSKLNDGNWQPPWDINNILNTWLWNGEGNYRSFWSTKTVSYIPASFREDYLQLAKVFRSSGIRHSIAFPTILQTLELSYKTIKLKGEKINKKNSSLLEDRTLLMEASDRSDFLYVEEPIRKLRREVLNDLSLKEFAMGKFLLYDDCPYK